MQKVQKQLRTTTEDNDNQFGKNKFTDLEEAFEFPANNFIQRHNKTNWKNGANEAWDSFAKGFDPNHPDRIESPAWTDDHIDTLLSRVIMMEHSQLDNV